MNTPEIHDLIGASEVLTPDQQRRAICLALAREILTGCPVAWADVFHVAVWLEGEGSTP